MLFWHTARVTLKTSKKKLKKFFQLIKMSYNLSRTWICNAESLLPISYRNSSDENVKVYRDIDLDIHRFISMVATVEPKCLVASLRFKTHIYNHGVINGLPMLIFSREKYSFDLNVAVLYKFFLLFHFWLHILYSLTVYINRAYHHPICRQLAAMLLFAWKQTESERIVSNSC